MPTPEENPPVTVDPNEPVVIEDPVTPYPDTGDGNNSDKPYGQPGEETVIEPGSQNAEEI